MHDLHFKTTCFHSRLIDLFPSSQGISFHNNPNDRQLDDHDESSSVGTDVPAPGEILFLLPSLVCPISSLYSFLFRSRSAGRAGGNSSFFFPFSTDE